MIAPIPQFFFLVMKSIAVMGALAFTAVSIAKEAKPNRSLPVVELSFVTIKADRREAYMEWIRTNYARYIDQLKGAGIVVDCRVHQAQSRAPADPEIIVAVKYKDKASMGLLNSSDDPKLAELNSLIRSGDSMVSNRRTLTEWVDS